ncbi:Ku protein [Actinacidiphila glaucinigra]|uniref:Ku protein n=1 Tax=Actinacidiphila glaucinigra TaxID=235986 RepID=UPI0033A94A4E
MRAIWTGYVSFGLLTLPVHLYFATEEQGSGFHQVHANDRARIRHRRACGDVAVPQSEVARGWERPDGRTVVLLDEGCREMNCCSGRVRRRPACSRRRGGRHRPITVCRARNPSDNPTMRPGSRKIRP